MPNSRRMSWPYPAENTEQWFVAFENFVNAMDTSGFAARDDRHLVVSGGGTVAWTLSSNTLEWSSNINIVSAITGFKIAVEATSVTLTDGQILYAVITRAPTRNVTATIGTGTQVPNTDTALLLAVRVGDNIYWRNGLMMVDGDSFTELGASQGGGGGGAGSYLEIGVGFTYNQVAGSPENTVGQGVFDGSLASAGNVYFKGILTPSFSSAGTASLYLYDMGPKAGPPGTPRLVATLSTTTDGGPQVEEQALTIVSSGPSTNEILDSARMYEATVDQSSTVGDTVYVGSVGLEVRAV